MLKIIRFTHDFFVWRCSGKYPARPCEACVLIPDALRTTASRWKRVGNKSLDMIVVHCPQDTELAGYSSTMGLSSSNSWQDVGYMGYMLRMIERAHRTKGYGNGISFLYPLHRAVWGSMVGDARAEHGSTSSTIDGDPGYIGCDKYRTGISSKPVFPLEAFDVQHVFFSILLFS